MLSIIDTPRCFSKRLSSTILNTLILCVICGLCIASALAQGGTKAWGANFAGQLGDGTTIHPRPSPILLPGLWDVVGISGGQQHTLAFRANGTVLAWGYNGDGQLGNGSLPPTGGCCNPNPAPVSGLTNVIAVRGGGYYSMALKDDGTVWVWGNNTNGQSGNGTITSPITLPQQVSSLSDIIAIDAGFTHSIALKSDGTVWTWGRNTEGQIGNGTSGTSVLVPVQVGGLIDIVAVAAGWDHSMALKSDGTVWVWGNNADGEIGNGTYSLTGCRCVTTPQQTRINRVVNIAAGWYHNVALTADGILMGWGNNGYGQTGNGTTGGIKPYPVRVWNLTQVTAMDANGHHTLALTSDGSVWAWGDNSDGQIGNGTFTTSGVPTATRITGLIGQPIIGVGNRHSLVASPRIPIFSPGLYRLGVGTIDFPQIRTPISIAVIAIDPNSTGLIVPSGIAILPNLQAYNITATLTAVPRNNVALDEHPFAWIAPATVCLTVPQVHDYMTFMRLRLLHGEGTQLVDRTVGQNYETRHVCGQVDSLSHFVIGQAL